MVIAFWNIHKKTNKDEPDVDFSETLIDFVEEQGIDILFLAEANEVTILNFLIRTRHKSSKKSFNYVWSSHDKICLLTSYSARMFSNSSRGFNSSRWSSFFLEIPSIINLNIVSVHFNSKLNWTESSLALECANFARDISIIEENTGCYETILIGDFNMNPFEVGMIAANGLHAIQDLEYSFDTMEGREVDGTHYKFFYNPMWNFFGDFKKPMGTHYHRASGHVSQEWNTYDQVIFRPTLKPYLSDGFVEIIDKIRGVSITKAYNRPNTTDFSDHLPIIFKLKI